MEIPDHNDIRDGSNKATLIYVVAIGWAEIRASIGLVFDGNNLCFAIFKGS